MVRFPVFFTATIATGDVQESRVLLHAMIRAPQRQRCEAATFARIYIHLPDRLANEVGIIESQIIIHGADKDAGAAVRR